MEDNKLFIDITKKEKFSVNAIKRNKSETKEQIQKKINTKISQLQAITELAPDRQSNEKSAEELISDLFVLFDQVKNVMTTDEMDTLYDIVKPYISDEKIAEIAAIYTPSEIISEDVQDNIPTPVEFKKKKALRINYSQALLITNKLKQGPLNWQYPVLDSLDITETNMPFTVTAWIKPNSFLYSPSKSIFKHLLYSVVGGKLGHRLSIDNNGKLTFTLFNEPIDFFQQNNPAAIFQGYEQILYQAKTAEVSLKIRDWNYIYYGINSDRKLFVGIKNSFGNEIKFSSDIINNSEVIDLKRYFNSLDDSFQDYNNAFNVGKLYWNYPQFLIGGIETKDNSTKLGNLSSINNTLPNDINNLLKNTTNIYNGYSDFDISSFRYYNKALNETEINNERQENRLENNLPSLWNKCYIDYQFNGLTQNKIDDLSGHGNYGYPVGDMNISFNENSDNYTIISEDIPEIISIKGPY